MAGRPSSMTAWPVSAAAVFRCWRRKTIIAAAGRSRAGENSTGRRLSRSTASGCCAPACCPTTRASSNASSAWRHGSGHPRFNLARHPPHRADREHRRALHRRTGGGRLARRRLLALVRPEDADLHPRRGNQHPHPLRRRRPTTATRLRRRARHRRRQPLHPANVDRRLSAFPPRKSNSSPTASTLPGSCRDPGRRIWWPVMAWLAGRSC